MNVSQDMCLLLETSHIIVDEVNVVFSVYIPVTEFQIPSLCKPDC